LDSVQRRVNEVPSFFMTVYLFLGTVIRFYSLFLDSVQRKGKCGSINIPPPPLTACS
jgi:hypothetical protein